MDQPFQVFISHFAGEQTIAKEIHDFLKDAFPTIDVFRSSDSHSIQTAEGQYASIIGALKTADIMIVLLSSESSRRPWMPFETGFAMGRDILLFTLLVRGATPSDLPSPFKEMQLRPIDAAEVEKILSEIERRTDLERAPAAIPALLRQVRAAEQLLPNSILTLVPYMMPYPPACLSFELHYEGTETITVRSITAGIPYALKHQAWEPREVRGHLDVERCQVDGVEYLFLHYTAGPPPPSHPFSGQSLKVIPAELYPPKDYKGLFELRFALRDNIDVFQNDFLIRCWIATDQNRTPQQIIPMSQLSPQAKLR